jgi:hypothetical protein
VVAAEPGDGCGVRPRRIDTVEPGDPGRCARSFIEPVEAGDPGRIAHVPVEPVEPANSPLPRAIARITGGGPEFIEPSHPGPPR